MARTDSDQANVDALAARLLDRHIEVSSPGRLSAHFPIPRVSERTRPLHSSTRTIAVVGAGASAPVFGRSQELVSGVLELDPDRAALEQAIERIGFDLQQDQPTPSFETALAAVGRSPEGEKRVREHIVDRYRCYFPILYRYELLAHLLKHRFLDAIVSFNFDELLDRSVRDELGDTSYCSVISAKDTLANVFDPDNERYLPVYIKPHGTVSAPSTLKFTRESYFDAEPGIADVLRKIIGTNECTVLVLGYSLGPMDFARLLDGPSLLTIFDMSVVGLDQQAEDRLWATARRSGQVPKESEYHRIEVATDSAGRDDGDPRQSIDSWWAQQNRIAVPPPKGTAVEEVDMVDLALQDTWAALTRYAGEVSVVARPGDRAELEDDERAARQIVPVEPRGIARHTTAAALFGFIPGPDDRVATQALFDRALLELSLAAMRARGLTTRVSLVNDRPHHIYMAYRAAGGTEPFEALLDASGLVAATYPAEELDPQGAGSRLRRVPDVFVVDPRFLREGSTQRARTDGTGGRSLSGQATVPTIRELTDTHAPELYRAGLSCAWDLDWTSYATFISSRMRRTAVPAAGLTQWYSASEDIQIALQRTDTPTGIDLLAALYGSVWKQQNFEVQAGSDELCRATFRHPDALPTNSGARLAEARIIDDAARRLRHGARVRLSISLLYAERFRPDRNGEPLARLIEDLCHTEGFSLRVMVGEPRAARQWTELAEKAHAEEWQGSIECRYVPWYALNRYGMLLTVNGRASKCLYFGRRNLVAPIAPLYLWQGADTEKIASAMHLRWLEAPGLTEVMARTRL